MSSAAEPAVPAAPAAPEAAAAVVAAEPAEAQLTEEVLKIVSLDSFMGEPEPIICCACRDDFKVARRHRLVLSEATSSVRRHGILNSVEENAYGDDPNDTLYVQYRLWMRATFVRDSNRHIHLRRCLLRNSAGVRSLSAALKRVLKKQTSEPAQKRKT